MTKSWITSKTLWLNILATAVVIVQAIQGQPWVNPEYQVLALAILNALVRLVTNTAISGTPASKEV
uniref:Uncharacterized protein n=1 Tax=viral metagenome TaxID=1070528 RepID=A0A6M3LCD8_9ZZZZ